MTIRRLLCIVSRAALGLAAAGCGPGAPAEAPPAPAAVVELPAGPVVRREIGFRTPRHLSDHFQKHGGEFPGFTKAEYLAAAQNLRDAALSESVLELNRPDGTGSRFDRRTGAFVAFDPDGTIRTFFKPFDGEAYFRRQARRRQE
ncbi:MAG: hypothetical protein AB7L66_10805 [Gemmatimonadales bacterium]